MLLKIVLKSFSQSLLKETVAIISSFLKSREDKNIKFLCVSLPKQKKKFCVIRSPHKHKDSREDFELLLSKKLIHLEFSEFSSMFDLIEDFEQVRHKISNSILFSIQYDPFCNSFKSKH